MQFIPINSVIYPICALLLFTLPTYVHIDHPLDTFARPTYVHTHVFFFSVLNKPPRCNQSRNIAPRRRRRSPVGGCEPKPSRSDTSAKVRTTTRWGMFTINQQIFSVNGNAAKASVASRNFVRCSLLRMLCIHVLSTSLCGMFPNTAKP